jgi:hypothetical protein
MKEDSNYNLSDPSHSLARSSLSATTIHQSMHKSQFAQTTTLTLSVSTDECSCLHTARQAGVEAALILLFLKDEWRV